MITLAMGTVPVYRSVPKRKTKNQLSGRDRMIQQGKWGTFIIQGKRIVVKARTAGEDSGRRTKKVNLNRTM
jgi:hypothetical protein